MADASTLRHYFRLDEDENDITRQHFVCLSKELGMSPEESEIIFTALDTDGKNVITLEELLGHWNIAGNAEHNENGNGYICSSTPVVRESESDFESSFSFDESFGGAISPKCGDTSTPANNSIISQDGDNNKIMVDGNRVHCSPTINERSDGVYNNNDNNNNYTDHSTRYQHDTARVDDKFSADYDRAYSNEDYNSEIHSVQQLKPSCRQLAVGGGSISIPSAEMECDGLADSELASTPTHQDGVLLLNSHYSNQMDTKSMDSSTHKSNLHHPPQNISSSFWNNTHQNTENTLNSVSSNRAEVNINPHHTSNNRYSNDNVKGLQNQHSETTNDQKSKVIHVISRPKNKEADSSSKREPQRRNSIRVLKIDNSTSVPLNSESEIQAPVRLELKPTHRKRIDGIDSASSQANDTVFEYDSSKLFGTPECSTMKKLRKKAPRPESVFTRRCAFGKQVYKSEVPVDLDLLSPPSQEQVCELYQNLHSSANPELVDQFENILLTVIKDVRQYKAENERLEKTYRKEKDEHVKHLRHMEDEMEQQVQNIEHRVRKQEKERLESEKVDLRVQLDSEITMLQHNLKKLQQDGMNKIDNEQEEHLLSMKKRLEDSSMQNRLLKSELTDAQTNLALVKTEMTSVKQQLDERTYELDVVKKCEELHRTEMEKLHHQLQGLHEANKNLLDTNDNLREMLDVTPNGHSAYKRTTSTDSGASARSASPNLPPRKGSVMSDYVDALSPGNRPLLQPSFQDEVGMIPQFMAMSHRFESCEEDSIAEELDSGHSTLRDVNEINDDTEYDTVKTRRGRRHRRVKSNLRVPLEEEDESHDEMESEGEEGHDSDMFRKSSPNHYRSASVGSRGSGRSQRSLTREESLLSNTSRSSRGSMRRQLPSVPKSLNTMPVRITKEPDRVYKIVLAGDAAVGKSSFIVRLCKGKFVPNLSSTLGVDFQTKMLEVDGNTTALQLWDTAGQERFRSVARTYFRRADGVLLLYDVTYERSFLNIREWLDAIEDNSVKKIPIMLVANKVDARLELEQQGRRVVKYEDGLKFSKEIDAHFIESSAKDGSNIHEAVIELTRTLRTNEDLEVQTVGLQLTNTKDKKDSSCCGKS